MNRSRNRAVVEDFRRFAVVDGDDDDDYGGDYDDDDDYGGDYDDDDDYGGDYDDDDDAAAAADRVDFVIFPVDPSHLLQRRYLLYIRRLSVLLVDSPNTLRESGGTCLALRPLLCFAS